VGPWTTSVMAEQRLIDLRAESSRHGRYGGAHGGMTGRMVQGHRDERSTRRWQRISEWAGYRMIGIGCRLARPAVVARVQAEL
jgi:hypothetical protein